MAWAAMSLSCRVALSKYPASQYDIIQVSFSRMNYLTPILIAGQGLNYQHK